MCERFELIKNSIGYEFSDLELLEQAFRRKAYVNNKDLKHNELLEYLGDSILSTVVIKELLKVFNWRDDLGFLNDREQGLVKKEYLSSRISYLGYMEKIITDDNEIYNNNIKENMKAKSDLFEAIVAAIAIDCNFDDLKLSNACLKMLDFNEYIKSYDKIKKGD